MAKYRRVKYQGRRKRKFMGTKRRRSIKSKSLSKRVSRLERTTRETSAVLNFSQVNNNYITRDYLAIPLTNYSIMTQMFGSVPAQFEKEQCRHLNMGMDLVIDMGSEFDKVRYTMFIVSLKDVATTCFSPSTGTLSLVGGLHYTILGGMAMVNKEFFNIHKIKRFATGNEGKNPTYVGGALGVQLEPAEQGLRRTHRFYMKHKVGTLVKNTASTWKNLTCHADPSKNHYMLLFNDNELLDLENPTLSLNIVHSIRV